MIMSVSTLIMLSGAATAVSVVNFSMVLFPLGFCHATVGPVRQDRAAEGGMTPHIEAKKGDYAEAVLLPGDPLRAEWVAKTFLDQPRLVNKVRNCLGYTGTYNGK